MQTVQVTLDEQTAATAETSANADGYGNVGDYVRAFEEADQRRRDIERLEAKVINAVESGDVVEMTAAIGYPRFGSSTIVARVSGLIRRRPVAIYAIIDCAEYIGRNSPASAERFMDAVEDIIRDLEAFPGSGQILEAPHPTLSNMRTISIRRFRDDLIFYRLSDSGIEIIHVLHGARDAGRARRRSRARYAVTHRTDFTLAALPALSFPDMKRQLGDVPHR